MDEQSRHTSASEIPVPVDLAVDPPRSSGVDSARSSILYCGDAARVREGFAVALRVMGIGASMDDFAISDERSKDDAR